MKQVILIIALLLLLSCEKKEVEVENIDFVVIEKPTLGDRYYLKSKDTIVSVNPDDYMRYNVGDTLKFQTDKTGFFRGTWFLREK